MSNSSAEILSPVRAWLRPPTALRQSAVPDPAELPPAMLHAVVWVATVLVAYRVLRTFFALLSALIIYCIAPLFYSPNLKKYLHRWTVVSGGTDGIGKAYTVELARRGLRKFILVGRNKEKLQNMQDFLELTFKCKVKTILFDFESGDFGWLREQLSSVDIGFVVNSVGVGRENLERYGDNPEADRKILKVNAIGSAEAVMSFLSECIDREYNTVNVQYLTPALVATKMVYYKKGGIFVVTPKHFAASAVRTIGLAKSTAGCLNHEIQLLIRHLFPWCILKYLIMPIYYYQRRRMTRLHSLSRAETSTPPQSLLIKPLVAVQRGMA